MTWATDHSGIPFLVDHRLPDGTSLVASYVRRAYLFDGKRLQQVREEPTDDAALRTWERADPFAAVRPFTDIAVHGASHAARPTPSCIVRVAVGSAAVTVRVIGDRVVEQRAGRLMFSDAQPFTRMPLDASRAFGGAVKEPHDSDESGGDYLRDGSNDGYGRNLLGRGYEGIGVIRAGMQLPNTEFVGDGLTIERLQLATSWLSLPAPAHFGAIDLETFPRVAHWLPLEFDEETRAHITEVRLGWLDRAHVTANDVPRGLAFQGVHSPLGRQQLLGGEPITIDGMHPERSTVQGSVPTECPIIDVQLPGARPRQLTGRLKSLLIEPERGLLFATWCGVIPVMAPYGEELASARIECAWR